MPNALTGDFDIVVEMAVPRINRILAAQHQAGVFPHAFEALIEDYDPTASIPIDVVPHVTPPKVFPAASLAGRGRLVLADIAEEGKLFQSHRAWIAASVATAALQPNVRANARVHASPPTVTLPASPGGARVALHFDVMAHVVTDAGSRQLPDFLHGDVELAVDVLQMALLRGRQFVLDFDFITGNLEVSFTPTALGFTPSRNHTPRDVARIEHAIATLMSSGFVCGGTAVDVPVLVREMRLKALAGGSLPAVALLLGLEGTFARPDHGELATPRSPASVTNVFVDAADDFAIALGRDFLSATVRHSITIAATDILRQITDPRSIISIALIEYKLWLANVDVTLESGILRLGLTIHAHRESGWAILAPADVDLSISQGFALFLDGTKAVRIAPAGKFEVDAPQLPAPIVALLVNELKKQFTPDRQDQLLRAADSYLQRALGVIDFESILVGLQVPSPKASYTAVEVTPEGVILRASLELAAWQQPSAVNGAVMVQEAGQPAVRLDAFGSWIPGGTVQSFTWRDGTAVTEEHRFMTSVLQPGGGPPGRWCVQVKGWQTTHTGGRRNVSRWSCIPFSVVFGRLPGMLDAPTRDRHAIVITRPGPDPVPDAYIDPWAAGLTSAGSGANLVVHFAGEGAPMERRALEQAIAQSGIARAGVSVILVLPRGQMARAAASGVARPLEGPRGSTITVSLTEDHEGSWQRTFEARDIPATYLLGPLGNVVWRHGGRLSAEPLAAALREHATAGGPVPYHPVSLRVQPGDRAPNFRFEIAPGEHVPLRRLRREPIALVFWTSWAEPSLTQLRHVERITADATEPRPTILAINDGEDPRHAAEVFRREGFKSHLVTDPERAIARAYGVHCWPTTVSLDGHGRVWNIEMGVAHHEDGSPDEVRAAT
jgi:peroxiredoxin